MTLTFKFLLSLTGKLFDLKKIKTPFRYFRL